MLRTTSTNIHAARPHSCAPEWGWLTTSGWLLSDRNCDQAPAAWERRLSMRWKISTGTLWNRSFLETVRNRIRPLHLSVQMKVPFTLGEVGHFGLAVRDPKKSAKWFERALGLHEEFEFDNGVAVGNDYVTIALFEGNPSPEAIDHMSFHLPDMATLRKALAHLNSIGADIEDPGDEIGPQ